MAVKMRITATVAIDVIVEDDEALDIVCEDIHEQIGTMLVGNDWTGTAELAWQAVG